MTLFALDLFITFSHVLHSQISSIYHIFIPERDVVGDRENFKISKVFGLNNSINFLL